MSSLLKIEFFKLFKRWPICLCLLLFAFCLPLFSSIKTVNHFMYQYSFWARISRDPDPYNFIINKITSNTARTTLICLIFWGLLITSLEYRGGTIRRLSVTKAGFVRIIITKTLIMILFGAVSLSIALISNYIVYKNIPKEFPLLFNKYSFWQTLDLIIIYILLVVSIIKIAAFHHMIMIISKKHYYIPITIGILAVFFHLFNLLPYGIFYRTFNVDIFFIKYTVYNTLIGFTWVILLYFIFFSAKCQQILKKYLPI